MTRFPSAEKIGGNFIPSRTSKKGRVCIVPGCKTILSVFNHESCCAVHHDYTPPRVVRVGSTQEVILKLLCKAKPGEWVLRPESMSPHSWQSAVDKLKKLYEIESRTGDCRGGYRFTSDEKDRTTTNRVLNTLRSGKVVKKPDGMSRGTWSSGVSRLRKHGFEIDFLGNGEYSLRKEPE